MEFANKYERFLRDKLNGMATKEQKVAYLKDLLNTIESERHNDTNTHFNEQEVVNELLKEIRG